MMSYPWRTTTLRRSTAEASREPTDGLNTPTVGLSTSTRCSTRPSTARAHSNPRTQRHTWTAAAPTRDSYTAATQPYTSSPIVAGGGVATGRLLSITSTSSGPDRSQATPHYAAALSGKRAGWWLAAAAQSWRACWGTAGLSGFEGSAD